MLEPIVRRVWPIYLIAWSIMMFVACGSPRKQEVASASDPPGRPPPNLAFCPLTYATSVGECNAETAMGNCHYPEGECHCGWGPPPCSGAAVNPNEPPPAEPARWQCTAKPRRFRADGCPSAEGDGPCTEEGKKCTYGNCCVAISTCKDGKWVRTGGECPP